ncbi:MAG: hypothetical protein GX447_05730 [Elusimicrobia bacterium]|nr:hypothetical protein [Elusimicrobiota bacterium]
MKKIYLCSFGLKMTDITAGTLEILKKCELIFLQAFDVGLEEFLIKNKIKGKLIKIKHPDNGNFSKIASHIISCSKKNQISVLSYGYPTFINGLYESLKKESEGKINIETVYSVGSLNPVIDLAGISDIPSEGLHIFNSLTPDFLKKIDYKKHLPCFIFNPHAFCRKNMSGKFLSFCMNMEKKGCSFYVLEAASAAGRGEIKKEVLFREKKDLTLLSDRTTLFIKKSDKKSGRR